MVADRSEGPPANRLQPPSAFCRRLKKRTARCSWLRSTRSRRWWSSRASAVRAQSASSSPIQWPSGACRERRWRWAREIASWRGAITRTNANMHPRPGLPGSDMDLLIGTFVLRPYVFGFLAAFLVAGAVDLGMRRTLVFAAWVGPLAWLAEFSSTRIGIPFGLYHYTFT